jgi:hypothetical protein
MVMSANRFSYFTSQHIDRLTDSIVDRNSTIGVKPIRKMNICHRIDRQMCPIDRRM